MKKIIIIVSVIMLSLPFSMGNATVMTVHAQEYGEAVNPQYTLLEPLPAITGDTTQKCTGTGAAQKCTIDIKGYIIYIFKLAIALAVFLAVVMITYGGFKYMTVESVTGKSDAKETITNAIFGLLGALGSYLILYTINPQLVNLSLITVPKLNLKDDVDVLNVANFKQALNAQAQTNVNSAVSQNLAAGAALQAAQNATDALATDLWTSGCVDSNGKDISGGDPDCVSEEKEYAAAQAQELSLTNKNTVAYAASQMTGSVAPITIRANEIVTAGRTDGNPDTTAFDADTAAALTAINNQYNTALAKLGNDAVAKTDLLNQKEYAYQSVQAESKTQVILTSLQAWPDNVQFQQLAQQEIDNLQNPTSLGQVASVNGETMVPLTGAALTKYQADNATRVQALTAVLTAGKAASAKEAQQAASLNK